MGNGDVPEKSQSYKKISANTVIINENVSDKERMYIILSGSAEVYKDFDKPGKVMISELTKGNFFGEMSLFLNKKSPVTVVASSDITVVEITKENARYFFARSPAAAYHIMHNLCDRLYSLDSTYEALYSNRRQEGGTVDKKTVQSATPPADKASVPRPVEAAPPGFFPEGHKSYVLPDVKKDASILYSKDFKCPICKCVFKFPIAKQYKLKKESTDYDMRTTYTDINMTHYCAVSCPQCLFSSAANVFEDASNKKAGEIINKGNELKKFVNIGPEAADADSIFTRLYLALEFMPMGHGKRDTMTGTAQIWLNISWLYRDCGDASMEQYAIKQALAAYLKVYSEVNLDPKSAQRVCMIIGELSNKADDMVNAKKFFFEAKINKQGFVWISDMAEDRLNELKSK